MEWQFITRTIIPFLAHCISQVDHVVHGKCSYILVRADPVLVHCQGYDTAEARTDLKPSNTSKEIHTNYTNTRLYYTI